jgi:glycosyltransferase involved in cell wall biosynthesis
MICFSSAPRVSVVIPTYNCAQTLAAAIDSALAQSFNGIEVIVVDDGSTDNTADVLARYVQRIRVIRQANCGLPAARNAGIRVAQAPLIALLDADDLWLPEKLSRQVARFIDLEVGIVYSDFSVRYADGRVQSSYLANRPLAGNGYLFLNYIQSRFLFPSTMVLRRKIMEECGLFDEEMLACEDIELFARMLLRCKAVLVNEPLMVRFEGLQNITADHDRLSRYTILALRKILAKERTLAAAARKVVHRELSQQYIWRAGECLRSARMAEVRKTSALAVRYDYRRIVVSGKLFLVSLLPLYILRRCEKSLRRA